MLGSLAAPWFLQAPAVVSYLKAKSEELPLWEPLAGHCRSLQVDGQVAVHISGMQLKTGLSQHAQQAVNARAMPTVSKLHVMMGNWQSRKSHSIPMTNNRPGAVQPSCVMPITLLSQTDSQMDSECGVREHAGKPFSAVVVYLQQ